MVGSESVRVADLCLRNSVHSIAVDCSPQPVIYRLQLSSLLQVRLPSIDARSAFKQSPFTLCVPSTNIIRRFSNLTWFLSLLSRTTVYYTVLSILMYVSFFNAQAALPHCLEYLRLAAHYHPVLELSSWVSHFNQLVSDLAARFTQEAWPQLSWPPTLACIVQSQNATVLWIDSTTILCDVKCFFRHYAHILQLLLPPPEWNTSSLLTLQSYLLSSVLLPANDALLEAAVVTPRLFVRGWRNNKYTLADFYT